MRINQVLAAKAIQKVITVSPDATVREMLEMLAEHNVGALVVSSDGKGLDGIVSERDVVRRLTGNENLLEASVSSIMTTDVEICHGDHPVNDLMQVMTEKRIRHVPVMDGDEIVGVISIGDVVKNRMQELEFERDQLDSYVHSAQT
ncbi:MAG TPA: CBS domain-containing protein [Nocardioidaceae bacterium]|jgi:CBS domain-containing protein|nr:CBS domain-containing protein [Nocardioidaceae bacterium]